jgi:hypothetical protein
MTNLFPFVPISPARATERASAKDAPLFQMICANDKNPNRAPTYESLALMAGSPTPKSDDLE